MRTRRAAPALAVLTGTRVGELAGYTVRGDRAMSRGARIEFATPGVLLRRLLGDPALEGTAAVVLDEVHERHLDADLVLAMCVDVAELREDLRLVAMSATLDTDRFVRVLAGESGAVTTVAARAEQFPLQVTWAPFASPRTDERGVRRSFLDHVAAQALAALNAPEGGDVLVFVPGAREVEAVVQACVQALDQARVQSATEHVDVLPLHGRLEPAEQDRALAPSLPGRRRIVVATSVAESSLTVPGVRVVVDAGLSREPRLDLGRSMSGLVTVAASRESAVQRAGRATRLGPGRVIRCYAEADLAHAREHVTPEIATADLTGAALLLAAWGTPRGDGLHMLDRPPAAALDQAERALSGLGAVDEAGTVTEVGRRMAAMPLDPRLARGLIEGAASVGSRRAAQVVAALADSGASAEPDVAARMRELGRSGGGRYQREVARLAALAGEAPAPRGVSEGEAVGMVVALSYPDQVARRVGDGPAYLLASGTRAALPPETAARLGDAEWLAVAEAQRSEGRAAAGTGAVIRSAARLDAEQALAAAAPLLEEAVSVTYAAGRLSARRTQRVGAIELTSTPLSLRGADARTLAEAAAALRGELNRGGLDVLRWSDSARALRRRLGLLHHVLGDPWPDVSDEGLLRRAEEWLPGLVRELAQGRPAQVDAGVLRALVPWPEAGRVDELAPETLPVASGRQVRLTYPGVGQAGSERVRIEVKLQETFGMATSPAVVGGAVRIQFHLLSPAGHPLAVTDDLASFWDGPYRQVRAEMRGRYPKHPWPDDPWKAQATSRTTRRRG